MTFVHPLLAAASAIVCVACVAWNRLGAQAALTHSNVEFLEQALRPSWFERCAKPLGVCATAMVVLAAAGPHSGVDAGPATVAICIDTSGSMNARDVAPNRAEAAVAAVRAFVSEVAPDTKIALVSFAGTAQTELTATSDRGALGRALAALPRPNGQTAIGDALLRAATLLPPAGRRAVFVLTDGTNNRGADPAAALRTLRDSGIPAAIVRIATGIDSARQLRSFGANLRGRQTGRDWAQPFAFAGLALGAAAWFARERGAFRL